MLVTMNKLVACSPFPPKSEKVEQKKTGGMLLNESKIKLQELNVVMFSEYDKTLSPGTKVFVRGDQVAQHWAKEVYTQDGVEFILVPLTAIQYISSPAETLPWQSGC